jgi:hypothetical protein
MPIKTFKAEVIQGHKGVLAVLVPFNPEELWKQKPVKLAGRRHGWLVKGSVEGEPYDGYIGLRWDRFFIMVDEGLKPGAYLANVVAAAWVMAPNAPGCTPIQITKSAHPAMASPALKILPPCTSPPFACGYMYTYTTTRR